MKTFTNCAEKKAKQFLNLLQGYTKGIRMTAILVLLLMGVSNAWAWDYPVGSVVYFEKPNNWSNAQFMIGHDGYSAAYNMTFITNTKLYQYQHTGTNWNGYGAWAVVDAKDWPAESNKIANRVGSVNNYIWYNEIKKYTLVQSNYAVSNNTSSFTSLLNKTQTITIQNYNTSNKKFEASNNTAGSVTAKYYTFSSSATSVGNQVSASITYSSSISAAYTSTVTLTASAKSGYQFVGWYDGTTLLSNNTTYNHIVPNSGKTIYARFIKTDAINTPVYLKTGDWKNDNARFAVYAFENTSGFQMWIDMSELDCSGTREYFTCKVPSNTTVILCRLNPDGSDSSNGGNNWTNKWGQTKDLTVDANNYWKFTGWDSNSDGKDEGTWTAYTAPTYTVTLVADSHGTYNVKSGNTTTTSKLSGNVTMNVALNSKITITTNTPQPGYDQSQGAAITIGKNDKQKATLGAEYTICGPTTITGNFVSTEEQVVYLQPTGHWNGNNAQYKAFVFHDTGSKWMNSLMTNVTCETDDQACYTCTLPAGYNSVIFCRVKDNTVNSFSSGNLWNQTNDLAIPVKSENNCYKITAIGSLGEKSSGNWKTFTTPTYPLTLKATPYGEYTVKCNGVSHTSSRTKDIVIDLPVGATVEITKAESYDAAYNNDLVIKTSSNSQYEAADLNTTYTFCGATTIEENFTTTAAHVVYLRVKTTGDPAAWNTTGANYIYCTNRLTNKVVAMTAVAAGNSEINQETGYNYFKATVPAGYRAFRFERKTASNVAATNTTEYFEHLLPLGQSNCFTIEGKNTSLGTFYGDWALGTADGDYRILYVEQQVAHGTDENAWKTVINTTYQHASDIIKKGDGATIVSLHIKYDKTKHPEVILQKFTNGEWVDVEGQAHMVLGPLTASADMAMLPGRRNTEGDVNLRYGDGIEEIKADAEENGKAGRVWNFVVKQSGASAHIDFTAETFAPYEGNYYIRTDNADGGWMTYAIPGNVMSHSEYSLEHSDYSHYFCKWVDKKDQDDPEDKIYTPNVKFVVANDYGAAISDTITKDDFTDTNGTLEADANVRWMWNEYTNIGSRAYIAGSDVANFLVAKYAASSTKTFEDKGEWVYEADLTDVKIDDKLTSIAATYDAQVQELMEETYRENGLIMLASAGNARVSSYTVRIVYDFKINQTICYLIPTGNAVATFIDVLIERINQDEAGQATQVTAAITPANAEGLTVYGLITLTQDHITDPNKSEQEALTYWISFPFDVKIGDITGFGKVGKHWMIKYYDGAERAAKGWFLDTKTFWKFFLDTEDVMKANTGYVLTLNKSLLNAYNPVYDNTKILKLYFPSKEKITGEINSGLTTTTVDVPEHWCNITSPADRTTKDSHWNMIGVPSFANKTITTTNETVKYFYDYSHKDDKYNTAQNAGAKTFKPMHAYMVQFAGVIDWNSQAFDEAQKQLAAKKNADAEEQYTLRLELQQNGTKADQTFVELHDDATTMFDMNVDLTKMFNASSANIYTLIGSDNQVAANVMPIANTVIPVGVQIAKAGEYTFAMPDGTDGITVELIDYETNIRTNLMLDEYTVDLAAGTNEARFALHVKPSKVTTSLEDGEITTTNGKVRKFLIDGVLYLQKDGNIYDAQGKLIR